MKTVFSLVPFVAAALGHTIFQEFYVNGVSQGHNVGIRYATTNNPIMNVSLPEIACNSPLGSSSTVINVAAGATVTAEWHHGGSGAVASDPDDPIATSHKGPVLTYLAAVSNAATTSTSGLKWFKIHHDGLVASSQVWAVDKLIQNKGKVTFTIPKCVKSGQYLLRHEIIALHGAGSYPGAQFYVGCAQINVTGGGSANPATVSFPGAYKGTDPGITVGIYYPVLTNYTIPGPAPITC